MRMLIRFAACALPLSASTALADDNPFVGRWALTLPNQRAGWLAVEEKNGSLTASILPGLGSVIPADLVSRNGDSLQIEFATERRKTRETHSITASCAGDEIKISVTSQGDKSSAQWTGRRIPPLPLKPNISKLAFGPAIPLLTGALDEQWQLVGKEQKAESSGWNLAGGVLTVAPGSEPLGHLRTKAAFSDFRITTEVKLEQGCNSGIYLRGVYEIQLISSHGKPLDSHNMGAVYSRIQPTSDAEKPTGEWQNLEITLVQRHITVVLNGTCIIDNQPVEGCTGGALSSDESQPGPIMLQKHNSGFAFRNMVLFPVKE